MQLNNNIVLSKYVKKFLIYFTLNFITILNVIKSNAQQINPFINFQAIARDQANNPLNNRNIYIKATILNKDQN